jgi:glycosyltransferase involved in cell wall biosynthesis
MGNSLPRNPTPWNAPLATRLQLLKTGTTRVAYFSELPDQASFRYRCYNMAQALNSHSTTHSGSYFFLADLKALDNLADAADVLVLSRVRYDGNVHRLIDQFAAAGKPVYSDIDDLIFSPRYAGLVARSLDHPTAGKVIDSWFALLSRVGETLRLSDAVLVSTQHLATLVRAEFKKPISVIPNFLNQEQLEVSHHARREQRPAPTSKTITLGYFSGSSSHNLDFAIVAPSLRELLIENPGYRLVLAGHIEVPTEFHDVSPQISLLPYMDILSLQEAISRVDINVVALQDNDFTYCKSELKFFEAAIVNTPTIATATPVFAGAITDGANGFLVEGGNWKAALATATSLGETAWNSIARAARKTAEDRYTPRVLCPAIEQVLAIN